ncbi:MAG: Hsp20/alpha crystallin family protein [Firmicutes bacterium]|nr:Hsp20/alpha crystallin family protein [Bacillota bacterium]
MYVSSFNPSQVVAQNQGYQTGATAFPISVRPSLHGNTVTYAFNPLLSQSTALGLNQAVTSQAWNPMLNQSLAWAFNPMMASAGYSAWNPYFSSAMAQNILPTSGISAWSPMANQMQQAFSSAFIPGQMALNTIQSTAGLAQMRVDLHETNSDIVVAAELPNVSLNDVNLTVTDDSLSISATAFAGNRATSLYRTVALPTSIKSEQVEATYANGILEIRAPKSDVVTRRKVKVNVT